MMDGIRRFRLDRVGRGWRAGIALMLCALSPGFAQSLLNGGSGQSVRLFSTDRAVLEAGDPRKDLPCAVTHEKPLLGFDLKFHAGFEFMIPMRELAGQENLLTILFRVTPEEHKDDPIYFIQRVKVPAIADDAKGEAYLQGTFDVGEGKYHVDWLVRDRAERVCSSYWDIEAALPPKDKPMNVMAPPSTVLPADFEHFRDEPPVERNAGDLLNVKVLVNFAPQNARSATMQPVDLSALVSILRTIARDPRIGRFTVVAFNMQEQRVLHRQKNDGRIDFPAIGKALADLKLGTVTVDRLVNKNGETEFLRSFIQEEIADEEKFDAVIIAGPKVMLQENVSQEALKQMGEVRYPVFYMNYNLFPVQVPWKDSISHAIKHFRGVEYTISRPRDLWYAVNEMVSRVVRGRSARSGNAPGTAAVVQGGQQ